MTRTPFGLVTVGPARLLLGLGETERLGRVDHLAVHGSLPDLRPEELIALAENINLRGRGGAGFPFARKLKAVLDSSARRGGRTAVVVNGSEGEPSCLKDAALLTRTPHLVLDGALLVAAALGAEEIVVGVTRTELERSVSAAITERGPGRPSIRAELLPERFVTGEGTALTNGLNTGTALPPGRKVRTSDSGLRGMPTLLSNTETFAQLAVAARMGALSYREAGLPSEPGTVLLTVAGSWVVETPTGVPVADILRICGTDPGQGVLVGGYHGGWLAPGAARAALISRESLTIFGGSLGAGAVLPLPPETCPLGEVVRVARWMAEESAGQCGPCVRGLPALATALARVVEGGRHDAMNKVSELLDAVRGRGACSHPDGTARFITSALTAFSDDLKEHRFGLGCGRAVLGVLPLGDDVPGPIGQFERLVVDWTLCAGHGLCAHMLPDIVQLGADGYPASAEMRLPESQHAQGLRAVRRCPALALRIEA